MAASSPLLLAAGLSASARPVQTWRRFETRRQAPYRAHMQVETFDYVIIGAGSAGCVLANRLTEDGRTTVCVLEAGPRDLNPFIHIPAGFIKTFYNPRINWCYRQEAGPW